MLVRRYGEAVINTISNIGAVLEYPKGVCVFVFFFSFFSCHASNVPCFRVDLIKESARPSYWVPDAEAPNCYICELLFGSPEELNALAALASQPAAPASAVAPHASGTSTPATAASPAKRGESGAADPVARSGGGTLRSSSGGASVPPKAGVASVPSAQRSAAGSASYRSAIDRRRHHCRACGNAVCAGCSQNRRPVPKRGWLSDVRVCNSCYTAED